MWEFFKAQKIKLNGIALVYASHRRSKPLIARPKAASGVLLQASVGCHPGYGRCGREEPCVTNPKAFAGTFSHVFNGSTQPRGNGDGRNDSLGLAVNDLVLAGPEGSDLLDSRLCSQQIG